MYDELVKSLRVCGKALEDAVYPDWDFSLYTRAADAIEKLSAYARQFEDLRKDGYYLQKTKMMTYGQATMTMPLPEPPKEEK